MKKLMISFFIPDLIILNVLIYKAKTQWHLLHLVMDVASVQDIYSHYVEVSIFLTILLQQFVMKPVGEVKDVEKVHSLVTSPKDPLKYHIHPVGTN